MIAIPPYILLVVYGAFLLFFVFFGLANIIHIARFGGGTWLGYLAVLFFVSASAIIVFLTWHALPAVDWTTPISLIQTNGL